MVDILECDETFVGGKNKNRHRNKRVKNSQGRSFKDKIPVFGMLERKGNVICKVVNNTSSYELTPIIIDNIKKSALLYTDEWTGYNIVDKIYNHYIVDHGRGQYCNGDVTTNSIEGFWSLIKRGYIGIYHYMSRKHLQKYVDEFVFRYNTRNMSDRCRFNLLLCNSEHTITNKELTSSL